MLEAILNLLKENVICKRKYRYILSKENVEIDPWKYCEIVTSFEVCRTSLLKITRSGPRICPPKSHPASPSAQRWHLALKFLGQGLRLLMGL